MTGKCASSLATLVAIGGKKSWKGSRWGKGGDQANNQLVLVKGSWSYSQRFRFIFLFLLLTLGSTLLGKILVLCENIQLAQTSVMTLCKHESSPSAKSQSTIIIGSGSDNNLVFWPEAWPGWFSFSSMSNLKNRLFTCLSNILWYLKNCVKIRTTVPDFQILSWQTKETWEDDKPFASPPGICNLYYFSIDYQS